MQPDVRDLLFERCRAMLDRVFAFLNGQVDFLSDSRDVECEYAG